MELLYFSVPEALAQPIHNFATLKPTLDCPSSG
jgi:hypothetical protein